MFDSIFGIERRRKERERQRKMETLTNFAVGAVIGVGVGAAIGILLAPDSGEETKKKILKVSQEASNNIKRTMNEKIDLTKEWTDKVSNDIIQGLDNIKTDIEDTEKAGMLIEDKEMNI